MTAATGSKRHRGAAQRQYLPGGTAFDFPLGAAQLQPTP